MRTRNAETGTQARRRRREQRAVAIEELSPRRFCSDVHVTQPHTLIVPLARDTPLFLFFFLFFGSFFVLFCAHPSREHVHSASTPGASHVVVEPLQITYATPVSHHRHHVGSLATTRAHVTARHHTNRVLAVTPTVCLPTLLRCIPIVSLRIRQQRTSQRHGLRAPASDRATPSEALLPRAMTPNQLRTPRRDKMLTFGSAPVAAASWGHRPVVSSPLSSSPMRASSPLSPIDTNKQPQRQVQSSPLQPPKFRFASRPRRPNPAVRRPEDVQETRRKTFLQRVRETSEDRTWKRRDIEGQVSVACSMPEEWLLGEEDVD